MDAASNDVPMAETTKPPMFGDQARQQLFHQRVIVLDGVLDDDNGTPADDAVAHARG